MRCRRQRNLDLLASPDRAAEEHNAHHPGGSRVRRSGED
jgi:hypothetical protein